MKITAYTIAMKKNAISGEYVLFCSDKLRILSPLGTLLLTLYTIRAPFSIII